MRWGCGAGASGAGTEFGEDPSDLKTLLETGATMAGG